MAPTEPNAAAVKLPASADFNAIYNKIALADASRASFLRNMRAKHPSLARPTAAASSPKTAGPNGAFSSMAKPPTGVSSSQPSTQQQQQRTRADDSDTGFENPSAGVGYAAPKSEEQTSAATRDLGRRLLGRRGPVQPVQKRRIQEDESEEEEGRTGLGRKKKTKRARTEEEDGEQDAPPPAEGNADTKTHAGESVQAVPGTDAEVPTAEEQDRSKNDDAPTHHDTRPETGEAKKKKKKKSKKRKENVGGSA